MSFCPQLDTKLFREIRQHISQSSSTLFLIKLDVSHIPIDHPDAIHLRPESYQIKGGMATPTSDMSEARLKCLEEVKFDKLFTDICDT